MKRWEKFFKERTARLEDSIKQIAATGDCRGIECANCPLRTFLSEEDGCNCFGPDELTYEEMRARRMRYVNEEVGD